MKRKIAALLLAGVLAGTGCQGGIVLAAETTTETEAPAETEEASEAASEAEAETMSEEERTEAAAQLLTDQPAATLSFGTCFWQTTTRMSGSTTARLS